MPAPARPPLPAAVVLAGGRATRMGGDDKGLMVLAGRPLVAHVVDSLSPQVQAVAINANGDPTRFAALGRPVLADTVSGHPGPLAGLLAGMQWAGRIGAGQIVSVPTDSPFVPGDLVARLAATVGQTQDRPALAASRGRRHPVVGLWPVYLEAPLRDFLAAGETRVSVFADRSGAVAVDFAMIQRAGREVDPFFNVNTPDDLAVAEAMLRETRK